MEAPTIGLATCKKGCSMPKPVDCSQSSVSHAYKVIMQVLCQERTPTGHSQHKSLITVSLHVMICHRRHTLSCRKNSNMEQTSGCLRHAIRSDHNICLDMRSTS